MHGIYPDRPCAWCGGGHDLCRRHPGPISPGGAYAYTCPATGERVVFPAPDEIPGVELPRLPAWCIPLDEAPGH